MLLTTVLGVALLGQGPLPGSDLSPERAAEKAQVIALAEIDSSCAISGSGSMVWMIGCKLRTTGVLKGPPRIGELLDVSLQATWADRLPATGESCICFLGEQDGRPKVIKVMARTDENLRIVRSAVTTGGR